MRESLLTGPVRIEEKLDGANLSFAINADGELEVVTRGGVGALDRGGHRGRARTWAGERSDELRELLADGGVLYGEWLLTRHGVRYDLLPDWLVASDLLDPAVGWLSPQARDERLRAAGLATPPALGDFDGIELAAIDALIGASTFGAPAAEGVIVRTLHTHDGGPRLAKRLAHNVHRAADDAFGRRREHNRLARRATAA